MRMSMPASYLVKEMDEEDASMDAEIEKELAALTSEDLEDDLDLKIEDVQSSESTESINEEDFPTTMLDYFQQLKNQAGRLENELEECDDILKETVLVSARESSKSHALDILAREVGEDPQTLRNRVIEELDRQDEEELKLLDADDEEEEDETQIVNVNFVDDEDDDNISTGGTTFISQICVDEEKKVNIQEENHVDKHDRDLPAEENQGENAADVVDSKENQESNATITLRPEQGVLVEVTEADLLEKSALKQLRELEKYHRQIQEIRKQDEDSRKDKDERYEHLAKEMRDKKQKELQQEGEDLAKLQKVKDEKLRKESSELQDRIQESMKKYQEQMDALSAEAKIEKELFDKQQEEKKMQLKKNQELSAVKIQKTYRGYRVRKVYSKEVKEKFEEWKVRKQQERINEIEGQREKVKMEERKKKEEEERKKKEIEEQKKKAAEEKKRKAEEEKQRKEDEKKKKEEEKNKKEEERLEAEKRKKEEEEKKKREEEERKRLEEEERKKKEEERKRKEAEEKKRLEEEEKRKKEEEEKRVKEDEERKRREAEEKKQKEEEEKRLAEEKKKKEEEDKRRQEEDKKKRLEEMKNKSTNAILTNGDHMKNEPSAIDKAILNDVIEQKRLAWIQGCSPWSKILNEQKFKKCTLNRRQLRRPPSAKQLEELGEEKILTAARVSSIQQVTTVELHDLPGCSLKTLGQCTKLRTLIMNNCNLVVVEGLENCKDLQYLDIQKNSLEMVDLKSSASLLYLNLSQNSLSSIHGLDGCSNLQFLNVSKNRITRIGNLQPLKHLHTLHMSHNQLISSRGLSDAPTLQELDLSHNHLSSVEDIDKLCLLQKLRVSGNNLLQVPLLANHVLLSELCLAENNITSLENLSKVWLPLLNILLLAQNSLTTVCDFSSCVQLKNLDLTNNQILDLDHGMLKGLEKLCSLQHLKCEENPVCTEKNFVKMLQIRLPRLQELDGQRLQPTQTCPIKSDFEAMCQSQLQTFDKLGELYRRALQSTQNKKHVASVHMKYFDTSYNLAVEHRNAHEYGDSSECTMQFDAGMFQNNSKALPQKTVQQTVKTESGVSKNKFENALEQATGNPNKSAELTRPVSVAKNKFDEAIKKDKGRESPQPSKSKGKFDEALARQSRVQSRASQESIKSRSKFEEALIRAQSPPGSNVNVKADTVKKALTKGSAGSPMENLAASKIQASWKGHSIRSGLHRRSSNDMQHKQIAAIIIQSNYRGYLLRKRLMYALEYAKFDAELEDDDEDIFGEDFDMEAFKFDETEIEKGWLPPETPQIPANHPVLKTPRPPSYSKPPTPPREPRLLANPPHPKHAWRNAESPLTPDPKYFPSGKPPLPPLSRMSDATDNTHRTGVSKKEDQLAEEWGFKDARTAEMMMQRAKKLKYNSVRKRKLGALDPKQRLALFRRLEETTKLGPVQMPQRRTPPRKEYFKAMEDEERKIKYEKQQEGVVKVSRTFEWVHTQVGDHDVETSRILKQPQKTSYKAGPGSMDLQSISESASQTGESVATRKHHSAGNRRHSSGNSVQLPPIKTVAPPQFRPGEKMSWRGDEVEKSTGWGGGKKRKK